MSIGWSNYHAHTKFCDGRATMEESVERAIKEGIKVFGFSSHAPVPFDTVWTMKHELLDDYFETIELLKERYKGQILILKSLEVDYIPYVVNPLSYNRYKLDYVIGSVHFVGKYSDGTPWSFDGGVEEFLKGFEAIYKGDIKACVKRYYALVREMVENYTPTILGHFDKIWMHNSETQLFDVEADWCVAEVDETLAAIKRSGVIVEINTKGFDRGGKIFPHVNLFKKLAILQIPITMNSDCHHIDKLTLGFDVVADELLKAGYTTFKEFVDGEWIDLPFTSKGIDFGNSLNF